MSAKTILLQMHHKAESFELLGKKLVLVLQEQFFAYIQREFNAIHLRTAHIDDSVHFHLYNFVERNEGLHLTLSRRMSTDVAGIERLLKYGKGAQILEEEIVNKIKLKLPKAIKL